MRLLDGLGDRLRRSGLPWFFLISTATHAAVLWHMRHILPRVSPSHIVIVTALESPPDSLSSAETTGGKTSMGERHWARQLRAPGGSAADNRVVSPSSSSTAAGDSSAGSAAPGLGDVVTSEAGVGVGGVGSPRGTSGAETGTAKDGSEINGGDGRAGERRASSRSKTGPAGPDPNRFAIPIPPAIQRTTSPYESEVYAEVDFYTLFTPDFRNSVNVPANQVCLEKGIIRTIERQVISTRTTDISKCLFDDYGDNIRMRCPKEAYTTEISYNNFLSSPVNYSVNVCLTYDRSSCYWDAKDDGPEREVCRVRGKYEGIWAQGTAFTYPCAKSTSESFSHPLQYEIRYLQRIEFPEERMRRRLVHREKRSLARCE